LGAAAQGVEQVEEDEASEGHGGVSSRVQTVASLSETFLEKMVKSPHRGINPVFSQTMCAIGFYYSLPR
jgi:hypothetical protein